MYKNGRHPGNLSEKIQGLDRDEKWSDLWYIYKPYGYDKTLAQMTKEERDGRKREKSIDSFSEFAKWYLENNKK